jgi:hypothetical protein
MTRLKYLTFDLSDNDEGITTIEALAATSAERHRAVMAEVQQVLDWAWRRFPHSHAPMDDGGQWDHDLQVGVEGDGWHAVSLTIACTAEFALEFAAIFVERPE